MAALGMVNMGKRVPLAGALQVKPIQIIVGGIRILQENMAADFAMKKARVGFGDFPIQREDNPLLDALACGDGPFACD
jgi:hypothetical protein